MKLSVIFWNNSSDASLVKALPEDIAEAISVFETQDFNHVIELLEQQPSVEMIITTLHPTDLQALFNIQQLQQRHPDVALLAIVDTMLRLSAVVHLLQRFMGQVDEKASAAHRHNLHQMASLHASQAMRAYNTQQNMQQNMQQNDPASPNRPFNNEQPTNNGWPMRGKDFGVALRLTPRQLDVLYLIMNGKSNKEIARILELSEGTVKIHCMAIFKQLGVTNRTQAAMRAEQLFPKLRELQENAPVNQQHAGALYFSHMMNSR